MELNNTHNLYGNEFIEICKKYCPGMTEDDRFSHDYTDIRMLFGTSIFARFQVLENKLYITPDIVLCENKIVPINGKGEEITQWPECDIINVISDTREFLINRLTNLYSKYKQLREEIKVKNLTEDFI